MTATVPRPTPGARPRDAVPPPRVALAYQPALDGLRAIAVLAVLLYHGQVSWARGGFLGVDLFFVLSGYLITSLLLLERSGRGSVDLARFWARRARRLLPALFLVLLAVCVYASVLARPTERESLRLDALSTLGYVANWRFALTRQSYFAQYDSPSPLRHMWSLGIEEQYYLVFPLVVVLAVGVVAGRRWLLAVLLLVGALGSAALMAVRYDPAADPSRVYYGTDTRAQALLIGALLAVWAVGRGEREATTGRTFLKVGPAEVALPGWGALGLAGLAGFVVLVVLSRDLSGWLYRGGMLLTALVCAALVAGATHAAPTSSVRRLLSWRGLTAVGVVSYGLYLWHWPVYVVLDPDRTGMSGPALLVFRLATTFGLAALSYHLVERPIRSGAGLPGLRRLPPLLAAGAAAGVLVLGIVGSTVASGAAEVTAGGARASGQPAVPSTHATRVYVIGDSVAFGLVSDFRPTTSPELDVRGSFALGCGLMAYPVVVDGQAQPLGPGCDTFDRRWPGEMAADDPDVAVLMLGIGEQFDRVVDGRVVRFGTAAYERFLDREVAGRLAVLAAGGHPVALVTVPCHDVLDTGVSGSPTVINDESRVGWLNDVQRRYVAAHPGVRLLDLHAFLCPDGYTDELDGVRQVHRDGMHLTPEAVQLVWSWLEPQLLGMAGAAPAGAVSAGGTSAVPEGRTSQASGAPSLGPPGAPRTASPTPAARNG